jgi:hypothetical protein
MDPLIKTAYALRCFYGESLTTGADLKTELNSFKLGATVFLIAIIAIIFISPLQTQGAQQFDVSPAELPTISPEKLDRSIDEIMERREFAWRMPREKPQIEESEESGPVISVLQWIIDLLKKIAKAVSGWFQKLEDWLDKIWPEPTHEEQTEDFDWRPFTRFVLILLLIVLAIVVVYYAIKLWRNRQSPENEIESETVVKMPDIRDEGTKADELPVNRWLDLAKELMAKGSLRLAMRALYLATLAYLSEKELIIIERYKSNSDYEYELCRRAHEKKDLLTAFSKTVMIFDRVWYGMYNITQGDVDSYFTDQERIMALVAE